MSVLDGYRVLDLSIAMSGPLAAMRLGDLGADVIKIEPPAGEWQRHAPAGGATGNQVNASFLALNRNKRSLAVDLKDDRGRTLLRELVAGADVFLQNYRPGWTGTGAATTRAPAGRWRRRGSGRGATAGSGSRSAVVAAINDDYRVLKGGTQ